MISLKESSDSISMPPSMIQEQEELKKSIIASTAATILENEFIEKNNSEFVIHQHQNSPKFLASSQSGIRLPPLTESTSPINNNCLEVSSNSNSTSTTSSCNNSPKMSNGSFMVSPKSPLSPNKLLFYKSTSYQSLLSNALQNSHIQNSSPPLVSSHSSGNINNLINNVNSVGSGGIGNSIKEQQQQQQQQQPLIDSPPPIRSSPKRLARNEKAKSSPPLSPIPFPVDVDDILCSSFNSSKNNSNDMFSIIPNNNNGITTSNNESTSKLPKSLVPLVLDKIQNTNYTQQENETTGGIVGGTVTASSSSSSSSSPNISPRTIVGRARSNSKTIQYSPNTSTCKIPPPPSPTSPNTNLPTPLSNINITPEQQHVPPPVNSQNDTTKQMVSSPPIPINGSNNNNNSNNNDSQILNSSMKLKNNDINILHINNNYICPSPSPSNMHSHYPPVSIIDFKLIEKIGEGGFGQVFLAKKNDTQEIVALKRMSKDLIWSKNKVSHIKNERDILAQGRNHRWIVSLNYSFQDENYLYLAMEYVPGGDLRSLLSALSSLGEDNARFYMAEMIEAVDSCHRLGYCHRDLKPENFLIDKTGHIKLADFGLSKNVVTRYLTKTTPSGGVVTNNNGVEHTPMKFSLNTSVTDFGSFKDLQSQAQLAYSVVGSPFYMAPEVLQATNGYGDEVDWWSLGCMFYEFIFGYPPFDGDSPEEVMETVLKWKTILQRPDGISDLLWDLISRLICDGSTRLGSGEKGVENIKQHPFFIGTNWGSLHDSEPPFVPVLENEFDTTYFENTEKAVDANHFMLMGADKLKSPVVYTNKNSGGFITSRSKQNRNILGFTYPRAQDDPMFLSNLLHNFHSSNEDVNTLDSSKSSLTPPYTSPYNSSENINFNFKPDPHSPYSSYKN